MERTLAKRSRTSRFTLSAVAATAALAAFAANGGEARADPVNNTGKGVVGGALLGAETVVIVESLAGVRADWAYWVGAGVGAVGGGIGGHFIETASTDAHVPVYMLAGGLALVIPAIVLTLNATRFMPTENASEDAAPQNVPVADPGKRGGSAVPESTTTPPSTPPPATTTTPPSPPPQSLFDMHKGDMRLGLPIPTMRQAWSLREQKELGVKQVTEYRMPLVHVSF
jgi:hypothetical protein